jgi:hypothetical protein
VRRRQPVLVDYRRVAPIICLADTPLKERNYSAALKETKNTQITMFSVEDLAYGGKKPSSSSLFAK